MVSGNNAAGRSSAVTGSVHRSTVTSSSRAHSASRRISHQQRQQQQSQSQQQQQPKISLGSLRNSDEHGSRGGSAQDSCDSSNDSGLGFEDRQQHLTNANVSQLHYRSINLRPTTSLYSKLSFIRKSLLE